MQCSDGRINPSSVLNPAFYSQNCAVRIGNYLCPLWHDELRTLWQDMICGETGSLALLYGDRHIWNSPGSSQSFHKRAILWFPAGGLPSHLAGGVFLPLGSKSGFTAYSNRLSHSYISPTVFPAQERTAVLCHSTLSQNGGFAVFEINIAVCRRTAPAVCVIGHSVVIHHATGNGYR